MTQSNTPKKRILFLMSDTGGGHRASMNAIVAALNERYGADNFEWDHVDVYRAMGFPSNRMPEWYPWFVKQGRILWRIAYWLSDRVWASRLASAISSRANRRPLRRMVQAHPADLVVSVHSVILRPTVGAYLSLPQRPPIITVVTDLITTPFFWYDRRIEHTLVPTESAFQRGLLAGMDPQKMSIVGLPVHPGFMRGLQDKAEARHELGWDAHRPTILIVGGSEGMGPLYEVARELDALKLECQLAIVAGRNQRLENRLRAAKWNQPTHIYPYVDYMPKLMGASDILVTKAGPSSVCEACIAGLPVVLYDRIPGQEEGNVAYVLENDIGVYAPQPKRAAEAVAMWLDEGTEALERRSARALSLAEPDAVYRIADSIWQHLQNAAPIQNKA